MFSCVKTAVCYSRIYLVLTTSSSQFVDHIQYYTSTVWSILGKTINSLCDSLIALYSHNTCYQFGSCYPHEGA